MIMLIRSDEGKYFCLLPDLKGKASGSKLLTSEDFVSKNNRLAGCMLLFAVWNICLKFLSHL